MPYDTNVLDHLHGFLKTEKEPATSLFFGVELEICVLNNETDRFSPSTIVADVNSALEGHAVICHDGSVASGFEIVTVPATLAYHKEKMWQRFFNSTLTERLVGMPYCGNHVHVSKAAWTPLTVGKLLNFVHNPDNTPFIDSISLRGQGQYCTRTAEYSYSPTAVLRNNHYRSAALNITPSETIEFRMFQSSINPTNLFKNLEFIDAIRMFTFHHKISDMNALKFLEFVAENYYMWPYLSHFLIKHEWFVSPVRNERPAITERSAV